MLYTMDGNDSLKQVVRRDMVEDTETSTPAPISELPTGLKVPASGNQ